MRAKYRGSTRPVWERRGLVRAGWSILVVLFTIQACVDEPRSPMAPDALESPVAIGVEGWRSRVAPQERGTRYDAPWWYMTDAELTQAVDEAEGKVSVGFKEPGTRGGVDLAGRISTSAGTVAAGKSFLRGLGLDFELEYERLPAVALTIDPKLVEVIRADPRIDYVEPRFPGRRASQDTTWNVERVNAPDVWGETTGSGIELLIIDSGIDDDHDDLDVAVIQGCDETNGEADGVLHGTYVAGVAAALDNTDDVVGVSHAVNLWSSRDGDEEPDPAYTACGVEFGTTNDVFVMNISSYFGSSNSALADAIADAWSEGLMVVAAVGNDSVAVGYPAAYGSVIGVTATDASDDIASFANYGTGVELSAPGVSITTTKLGGGTATVSGTSVAAPHVAAAVALIKAEHPGWSNSYVRQALRGSAEYLGSASVYGYGLLDVAEALGYEPMDSLTVSISGPTEIEPEAECTWTLSTNGTAPYTITWYQNFSPVQSGGTSYTGAKNGGILDDYFELKVNVTDAIGVNGEYQMTVYEDEEAPLCTM